MAQVRSHWVAVDLQSISDNVAAIKQTGGEGAGEGDMKTEKDAGLSDEGTGGMSSKIEKIKEEGKEEKEKGEEGEEEGSGEPPPKEGVKG